MDPLDPAAAKNTTLPIEPVQPVPPQMPMQPLPQTPLPQAPSPPVISTSQLSSMNVHVVTTPAPPIAPSSLSMNAQPGFSFQNYSQSQPSSEFPQYQSLRQVPGSDGYIMSAEPGILDQTAPTNWLKTGIIVLGALVILGGTGSAVYMIKSTTDSLTKAAKTQQDTIDDILNESGVANGSLSLIPKVQAGYEDPFSPTADQANPFEETKNPFDEIGY